MDYDTRVKDSRAPFTVGDLELDGILVVCLSDEKLFCGSVPASKWSVSWEL